MRKKLLQLLFLAFFMLATTVATYAQVTTATLTGTVLDETGAGMIGATVVAIHEPTSTQFGVTTRDDGRYTIPNLRVDGDYTVQVSFVGYKTQKMTGVNLLLGQRNTQNFKLEPSAVTTDEVIVTADPNDILSSERTGAETNISNEQLRTLPTISRSASDFTRLTPASDGNSFGGRNDQFNNFSLDGSIFNNPFGLDAATPGGQTNAQPVSLDAIEQIQVSLAPYDVTQAGFTGAAVNAVTKSGTNEFKGSVFGFYRNQDLTGSKVSGNEIFVPDLRQFQTGFAIGGPLVKDKIFFFANLELERRQDLGSNFVAAATGVSGENVSRVEAADLMAVSQALQNRFGYETGAYEGYTHNTNNQKGLLKLDFVLNASNTLTATYNFLDASKDNNAHPFALGRRGPDLTTLQFENSGYRINNVLHSGIVELRSIFGSTASNKLQVGYTAFRDSRDPFSTPFPVININRDGIRYIVAGHEPFSINNRLDQDVFQISNNFNLYMGSHTLTFGTSLERFDFNNSFNLGVYDGGFTDGFGGTFSPGYPSVDVFLDSLNAGVLDAAVAGAQSVHDANTNNDTWALAETNVGQWAIYAQDEWAASDKLTITAGVRIDMPLYFNTPQKIQENIDRNCCYIPTIEYFDENGNTVMFDHTVLPKQTPLISPRLGFNYDANGDQSMQVRGGTGLFSGRLPFVWIGNQVANPNFFFYNITSPDFKFPQVWRTNLGYDQKFGDGWVASTDLIYTKDINGMMVRNYGINAPTGNLPGVDGRKVYTAADRNSFGNNAYVFTNTDVGYSFNWTAQVQKTWGDGWYSSLSYNFLEAKDASSIEAEISSDAYERNPALGNVNVAVLAPSIYGNRHRFVGTLYKKFDFGTSIALFMETAQGGRFSYTYSGDINGDGSGLNDLIYIPSSSEVDQMTFAGDATQQDAQRAALKAYISQDDYLSANVGGYAEKYAILSPWYSKWDLRVLQDITVGGTDDKPNVIQISLDVLNVGNLLNSNWGVRQFPINNQPIGVSIDGNTGEPIYSFDNTLNNTFADDFSLLSRWQVQFGVRYSFGGY